MSRLDVTATRVWNDSFTTTDHSTHEWPNHTAKEAATERAARLHSAGQSVTRHGNTLTVVSEHHPSATDSYVETLVLAWTDEDGDANLLDRYLAAAEDVGLQESAEMRRRGDVRCYRCGLRYAEREDYSCELSWGGLDPDERGRLGVGS